MEFQVAKPGGPGEEGERPRRRRYPWTGFASGAIFDVR